MNKPKNVRETLEMNDSFSALLEHFSIYAAGYLWYCIDEKSQSRAIPSAINIASSSANPTTIILTSTPVFHTLTNGTKDDRGTPE